MSKCTTAIILAAGQGTRMQSYFQGHKSMISVNDEPLIEHSIRKLILAGITDIVIVTGHLAKDFEYLTTKFSGFVELVFNYNYDRSGSLDSLKTAANRIVFDDSKDEVKEVLVLESDIWYDQEVLKDVIGAESDVIAVSDDEVNEDMVYVYYTYTDTVSTRPEMVDITKQKPKYDSHFYKYFVGITKFSRNSLGQCLEFSGEHYEEFFTQSPKRWNLVGTRGKWMEMDCEEDVETFYQKYVMKGLEKSHIELSRNVLLNPGPATTTMTARLSLASDDICPREEEFKSVVQEVKSLVNKVYDTAGTHEVVLIPGSGTSAVEAVLTSLPKGSKLGIIVNGAYGKRMTEICDTYNIEYSVLEYEWDKPTVYFGDVERFLGAISHLAFVHHETTTGYMVEHHAINMLARSAGVVTIMDAMSSFAGTQMKTLPDYVISSSNKCIHGFAGIGFVLVRKTEIEKNKDTASRSYFLDLWKQEKSLRTGEFRFTPPVQVIYGMRQSLREFFARGGVDARIKFYKEKFKVLHEGVESLGLRTLIPLRDSSEILMTVLLPDNLEFNEFHDYMYERGYTIYPGKVGGLAFRLAVIGESTVKDMEKFIEEIKNFNAHRHIVAYEYSN